MTRLAPIGISTYTRLRHIRRTIEALKRNPKAKESELFVFSDAPKPGDEDAVAAVRHYLKTITGFRAIEIIERTTNGRTANTHGGKRMLIDQYGRMIVMEEDIVVAPGFLDYMNHALDLFECDPRIFAVTGYSPGMRLEWSVADDIYLSPRFSGWGYGIWKSRYDRIPRRIDDWDEVSARPDFQARLARLGDDYLPMLQHELAGAIDAGDVRMNYLMARDDLRVVAPTRSLTENTGHDSSGIHCGSTQRFSVDLDRPLKHHRMDRGIQDNLLVIELLRRFRSRTDNTQPWQDEEILNAIGELTGQRRPLFPVAAPGKHPLEDKPVTIANAERAHYLGEDIVFLLGLPRSGTTLLQRLLGENTAIHTTAEPWLLLPFCQMLRNGGQTAEYDADLARQGIQDFLLELPGGEATFMNVLRHAVGELYGKCSGLHGARYFLDKTPRYHYIVPELIRLFPRAKFIFLFRNPLAVLASVAESWFGGSVANALADDSHGRDLVAGPGNLAEGLSLLSDRACVVQYESLVTNAEEELSRICRYLDIPFEPAMLKYDPAQRFKGSFGDSIGIPKYDRATTESIGKWQQILLRSENVAHARAYLAQLPEGVVRSLGYDPDGMAEEFATALLERVKAGQCSSELLDHDQRLRLANVACTEAEEALAKGDYEAAAQGLQETLSYVPGHSRALNDMGAILWAIDDRQGAVARFGQAVAADPDDQTAVINCVDALTAMGREGDARQVCFAYLERHPDDNEIGQRFLTTGENESGACGPTATAEVKADDFGDFVYSRRSHFAALGLPEEHAGADIDDCDLKVFQDMLMYRFIVDNFAPGARLLEIGGGASRIICWLKDRYEFWNLDKLEGVGNGLTNLADTHGFRLVRDYIGAFSTELPAQYFDGVFSLSTLEHVPESEECYRNILADIDRVLKPGGLSAHAFDIVMRPKGCWTNAFLPYILENVALLHKAAPFWKIRLDPDTWTMSRKAYERLWQPVTRRTWEDSGQPLSYNVCWRKPVVASATEDSEGADSARHGQLPALRSTNGEAGPTAGESPTTGIAASVADTFCILPWLHLQFNPEGSVKLCCMAESSLTGDHGAVLTPYGETLNEIWNSASLGQVRQAMMNGVPVASCAHCYEQERRGQSYRLFSNQRWAASLGTTVAGLQERILRNGVERGLELAFLQLNLGNLCNLKCRMCSSTHSSQIARDPVHSRWRPRNPGNLAGIRLPSDEREYRFRIDNQHEVSFDGFHKPERHEGILCRWTDGRGRIVPQIKFPSRPTGILLQVLAYRPIASHGLGPLPLRVAINGREVFVGEVARGLATLEFAVPETGDECLSIDLDSPTYARNGRPSGIGLVRFEVRTEHRVSKPGDNVVPLLTRLEAERPWHESNHFIFGELLADTSALREIYFTGGEPFINRQVRKILATMIERGDHERIVLQFNSNLTSVDADLLAMLSRFSTVNLAASIDSIGSHYEYLRYPAKWERVAKNIHKIRALDNVNLTFIPIISAYNVSTIVDLCRYCDSIDASFVLFDMGGNPNIDLGVLPPSARRTASARLRDYAIGDCRAKHRSTVLRIADRLDHDPFTPDHMAEFMEFTNDLDAGRRFDFRIQHAELCALMAQDGHVWAKRRRYA